MSDPLDILAGFLRRFHDEVEGRGEVDLPPPDVRNEMQALVAGQLDDDSRDHLVKRLRGEPGWVEYLAELMRTRLEREETQPTHD